MLTNDEAQLRKLLLDTLKPIARILLDSNMQVRETIEILKAAFANAASEAFGKNEKSASVSQIARVTGLTRLDISRLLEKYAHTDVSSPVQIPRGAEVLTQWHTKSRYLNRTGEPQSLQYDKGENTFVRLVEESAPGEDPKIVLDDLLATGSVERTPGDEIRTVRRNLSHSEGLKGAVAALNSGLHGLAHTVDHNLQASKNDTWLQRLAFTSDIDQTQLAYVRNTIRNRGIEFSYGIDDLLIAASSKETQPNRKSVGVGIYYYELDNSD